MPRGLAPLGTHRLGSGPSRLPQGSVQFPLSLHLVARVLRREERVAVPTQCGASTAWGLRPGTPHPACLRLAFGVPMSARVSFGPRWQGRRVLTFVKKEPSVRKQSLDEVAC